MEATRLAPLVGIAGCVGVLAALAYPFFAVEAPADYFGAGAINPLAAGLLALVAIVVLAAGREGRTDPAFAAGVAIVLGLAVLAILALWAVTLRLDVVTIDPNHRWIATAVAVLVPVGAGWFARSLGLV
jgi:hypothetical protein